MAEIEAETGLPADDPVRFGADRLWAAIHDGVESLPWVDDGTSDPRPAAASTGASVRAS